jgi:hypothetical protein
MKVIQAELIRVDNEGIKTVAWIEIKKKLKESVKIRLKGSDVDESVWWRVNKLYESIRESESIHKDWKVGGLE